MTAPTALIAEDEPLLAQALQAELARAWPQLRVLDVVGDGASAVRKALDLQPDVLFFDIRMPGLSGLDAAAELADQWPTHDGARAFPALVFVTAYDQYAVQAFEAQAQDYLLKPLNSARLQKTVHTLQQRLTQTAPAPNALDATLEQLRQLLGAPGDAIGQPRLTMIQASVGNSVRMVPIDEVLCLEAADKYVRVLTALREYLIRTPLKDLQAQLDPECFWQVHRGTLVRASAIDSATRDESGRIHLQVRGLSERFVVSRLYAHRFKPM